MANKSQYGVALINTATATSGPNQSAVTFNNNTTSSILSSGGTSPVGLLLPSSFLAATVSFSVSKDGINFYTLTDFDGSSFTLPAAGGTTQWIPLQPAMFCGVLFVKVVSSVTQSASPTVDFSLAPIFQGVHA